MSFYTSFTRPLLFSKDPEDAHHLALGALTKIGANLRLRAIFERIYCRDYPSLRRTVAGIDFPNPVGLAAGFDKNGVALRGIAALGPGFIEVGTVTGEAQVGNDRPRIFRYPQSQALVNRMGFNNLGPKELNRRLNMCGPLKIPLGINIGKSKNTPNSGAAEEYLRILSLLYRHGNFYVVNVSSPNTPGLRELQDKELLREILVGLLGYVSSQKVIKPIFVKIAPDLTTPALDEVLELLMELGLAGVVLTNTTIDESLKRDVGTTEMGGLSGQPLHKRALEVVSYVHAQTQGKLPIIGSGGNMGPDHTQRLMDAGASLVEVYTGLVYEGPGIFKSISSKLADTELRRRKI